jgi:hypothetical protein
MLFSVWCILETDCDENGARVRIGVMGPRGLMRLDGVGVLWLAGFQQCVKFLLGKVVESSFRRLLFLYSA